MEISLNLLWLLVAVIAVSLWIFRWRRASRTCALSGAVALTCALVLLFPSVSLTDDLHPEIVAVDAAIGKRSICQLISSGGRSISHAPAAALKLHAHAAVALLPHLFLAGQFAIGGMVADEVSPNLRTSCNPLSGRSPPLFKIC
jgi:hypothetical protein